jgi:hypothetical protein
MERWDVIHAVQRMQDYIDNILRKSLRWLNLQRQQGIRRGIVPEFLKSCFIERPLIILGLYA